ncbi:DUF4276 family protein [Verminephrobacter eiseniae]|nr:DUF4276 family protein [Verminephrobacter eiseniae]
MEKEPAGRETGAMIRVYLLVEGQTEETFVNDLLQPHCAEMGLYLTPIIVSTSTGHRGGVVRYAKVKSQIERLCKQDARAYVSTLFDLYALPDDFPGKSNRDFPGAANGRCKAEFLEAKLAADIGQRNFIAHLQVHEFEALLFTRIEDFTPWVDDASMLAPLRAVRKTTAPEDINDSPQTAPSKRILAAMPHYQKTSHGPQIACAIGLHPMRAACPHFDHWLQRIEGLA